ncbi:iron chelate uptake ABC transporter family permease subunit [Rhizobium lentis]|nr:iron chelate uptake ABC transporter family permease subunit [Rhizobium lentis]MBX5086733.1 iron chelate uptake ABC transporter family permease subunit [Rhizobium lentis]MBX5099378.1 iron chelate uptake ABC transporter family permease subunit [Rhizobium lentis]MBX5124295.1 iron chelate uptake ABC transporter family permease subunit [Rhizobium lentis]
MNTRTWSHGMPAAIGFALLVPFAVHHARRLDIIEMGDDAAQQLGVDAERSGLVTRGNGSAWRQSSFARR